MPISWLLSIPSTLLWLITLSHWLINPCSAHVLIKGTVLFRCVELRWWRMPTGLDVSMSRPSKGSDTVPCRSGLQTIWLSQEFSGNDAMDGLRKIPWKQGIFMGGFHIVMGCHGDMVPMTIIHWCYIFTMKETPSILGSPMTMETPYMKVENRRILEIAYEGVQLVMGLPQ